MEENKYAKPYLDDDEEVLIDFGKYFKLLKDHWKTIMWWTIGGFVFGCLVALGTPHKYEVTTKLAPELSSTATNRLASMASLVGFSSQMLGTTDAVYPMVYPDLVKSPEFIADLFEVPVSFEYKKEQKDTTLYRYLEEYQPRSVVGEIIGFPMKMLGKLMDLMKNDDEEDVIVNGKMSVDPFHFTKKQWKIYKLLQKNIEATIDKKTLVVTVSLTLSDKVVCATVSRAISDNIQKYVTMYRTNKAVQERDYYKKLYEEAKLKYYMAQDEYSRYVDSHQGMVWQSVMVERERLHNEANLEYQLYTSMAQQLQNAEAKVQQDTPVFAEVVQPTVPFRSANSRKKMALAFAFLGCFCGGVYVIIRKRE